MGALSDWIAGIETEVESIFSAAEKSALVFFKAIIDGVATAGPTVLADVVTSAVAAAETSGGTGAQKLAAAQTSITQTLAGEGITVASNIVNGAIEAAVATLKASSPSVPAATGATEPAGTAATPAPVPAPSPSGT